MWFGPWYWSTDVLDQCICWKTIPVTNHAICCSCCQFELHHHVQIKQSFTHETQQPLSIFRSKHLEPSVCLTAFYISSFIQVISFSPCGKSCLCFVRKIHCSSTLVRRVFLAQGCLSLDSAIYNSLARKAALFFFSQTRSLRYKHTRWIALFQEVEALATKHQIITIWHINYVKEAFFCWLWESRNSHNSFWNSDFRVFLSWQQSWKSNSHTCTRTHLQSHSADQVCLESSMERPVLLIRLRVRRSTKKPSV